MIPNSTYIDTLTELRRIARQTRDPIITELIGLLEVWIDKTENGINIGDVSNSTGVAIGRNIDMTINQYALAPEHEKALKTILSLLQNQTSPMDCPQCSRSDMVQKVHVVINNKNLSLTLKRKLSPPEEPIPPRKKDYSPEDYQVQLDEFLNYLYPNWKRSITNWKELCYCSRCDICFKPI